MSQEQRKQQMQQGSVREIRRELRMLEVMRCVEEARHTALKCAEAGCRIDAAHGDADARPGAGDDGDGNDSTDADRDITAQESAAWAQQRRKRMVSALLRALHDNVTTTAELLKLEEQSRTSRLGDADAGFDAGPRRAMKQLAAKAAEQRRGHEELLGRIEWFEPLNEEKLAFARRAAAFRHQAPDVDTATMPVPVVSAAADADNAPRPSPQAGASTLADRPRATRARTPLWCDNRGHRRPRGAPAR